VVADDLVSLWALLPLDDVEFYFVAFFEAFVAVDLDGAVVDENVRTIFAPDKAITLRIVEPLDFACVLSHEPCPSLIADSGWGIALPTCM
jgi:hypothetical protein